MRKGTETEKIDYDEAIFFTVIVPAPPPECTVSSGYRSGAAGSSLNGSPRARLLLALFPVLSPALSSKMSPHPLS